MAIFITATSTHIGKTLFCSLVMAKYGLQKKLRYFKPIQTGIEMDREQVMVLSGLGTESFLSEAYHFRFPASPHWAAEKENKKVDVLTLCQKLQKFRTQPMLIEGAGGLYVPITHDQYMIDLIQAAQLSVILVAPTELGAINQTMLSLVALRVKKIACLGIYFVGKDNLYRENNIQTIEEMSNEKILGEFILPEREISPSEFRRYAQQHFDESGRIREMLI